MCDVPADHLAAFALALAGHAAGVQDNNVRLLEKSTTAIAGCLKLTPERRGFGKFSLQPSVWRATRFNKHDKELPSTPSNSLPLRSLVYG